MISEKMISKSSDKALENRFKSNLKQVMNYLDEMCDIKIEQSKRLYIDLYDYSHEIALQYTELKEIVKERI